MQRVAGEMLVAIAIGVALEKALGFAGVDAPWWVVASLAFFALAMGDMIAHLRQGAD